MSTKCIQNFCFPDDLWSCPPSSGSTTLRRDYGGQRIFGFIPRSASSNSPRIHRWGWQALTAWFCICVCLDPGWRRFPIPTCRTNNCKTQFPWRWSLLRCEGSFCSFIRLRTCRLSSLYANASRSRFSLTGWGVISETDARVTQRAFRIPASLLAPLLCSFLHEDARTERFMIV